MSTTVISLGGSLICPKEVDSEYLKKFRQLIVDAIEQGKKFGIVTGGGLIARQYIQKANEVVHLQPTQNDWIGIGLTLANARLVREIFGDMAYQEVVSEYKERIETSKPIIVGGGWKPGCSTDHDTVLLAKLLGAKTIINLTNVEYVYDKDPRKFKDAKPLKRLTWHELKQIVGGEWKAGMNLPFDPVAASLAEKEKMHVIIMNGADLQNLERCLAGMEFKGTVIG